MKTHQIIAVGMALVLCSCVQKPSITTFNQNDGTFVRYNVGTVVAAKEGATVTEITGPGGYKVKHMSEAIDATEVVKDLGSAWVAGKGLGLTAHSRDHAASLKTQETLGAQGVQKNKDLLNAQGKATSEHLKAGGESLPIQINTPGS